MWELFETITIDRFKLYMIDSANFQKQAVRRPHFKSIHFVNAIVWSMGEWREIYSVNGKKNFPRRECNG